MKRKSKMMLVLTVIVAMLMAQSVSVLAASKITLKSGAVAPSSVYTGHTYTLKVAGTAVRFYSSKKSVATIGVTTGKMKPVAPGTVTITAKNKKTGKTVATKKFTVLQRATSVTADPTEVYVNEKENVTLKATKTPATSTDVIRFYSTDKTIATVGATSGKITGVRRGHAQVKVYSKATKATSTTSKYNKTALVDVYVGPYLNAAAQDSLTKISLGFHTDVTDETFYTGDFKVLNVTKNEELTVLSVEHMDEGMLLTTEQEMNGEDEYQVTYLDSTATFKATDGVVSSLSISPITVKTGESTEISVVAVDKNGMELWSNPFGSIRKGLDFTLTPGEDGYLIDSKLCILQPAKAAVANAIWHIYDESGAETGTVATGDVNITSEGEAVEPDQVTYSVGYSDTSEDAQKIPVYVGGTSTAYFTIKNPQGTVITDYSPYTFESSNTDVLTMGAETLNSNGSLQITGQGYGSGNIVVKKNGMVIAVKRIDVTYLPYTPPETSTPAIDTTDHPTYIPSSPVY